VSCQNHLVLHNASIDSTNSIEKGTSYEKDIKGKYSSSEANILLHRIIKALKAMKKP